MSAWLLSSSNLKKSYIYCLVISLGTFLKKRDRDCAYVNLPNSYKTSEQ